MNDEEFADLYNRGATMQSLADRYGVSVRTITRTRERLGLGKRTRGPVDADELARLFMEGLPVAEIAERLGVTAGTVTRTRRRLGLPSRSRRKAPEDLARIESMLDEGMSFKEIHRTMGVDVKTIRRHFPGRQWTVAQRVEFQSTVRFLEDRLREANYAVTADRLSKAREAA